MNFFDLFRHVKMDAEPGAGGGEASTAADTSSTSTSTANVLDDINASKTVGEIEAEQNQQQNADQETPEAKQLREAAEAKVRTEVPETYAEFKMPEGVEANADLLTKFGTVAKELGLTQDQAQKLVDLQAETALAETTTRQEMLEKALETQKQRWADDVKNDPELGGAKFDSTIATATKAMQAFGSTELRQLLNESGLGNHPQMVKLFHAIGTSISEDRMVIPGSDSSTTEKSAADTMFGDVQFN